MDERELSRTGLSSDADGCGSIDNNHDKENGKPMAHEEIKDTCQYTPDDEHEAQCSSNEFTNALQETGRTGGDTRRPETNHIESDDDHESASEDGEHGPPLKDTKTTEEQFMLAIESGEVTTFMDMLSLREQQLNLNINYKNDNGQTPLRLAITGGSSVMVEHLLLHGVHVGDSLLRAVDVGFEETIVVICRHASKHQTPEARLAILNGHCEDDDYHPDVTPIALAAQRNDFTLVKLLRDYGCRIDTKKSSSNATDELQKSVGSLEIYKALASEAYLSQVNEDPIEASFKLSKKLRKLSQTDVEFKLSYLEMAEATDVVGTEIISFARDTEELLTVLNHREEKTNGKSEEKVPPLPKLSRAIYFNQKGFVAQQNCQQAVLSQFYGHMAFLRDKGTTSKLLFFLCMVIGFPIISLTYLYIPTNWVKTYIGSPYMKFVLKFASDLIFVVLLTVDIVLLDRFKQDLSLERPTQILLFAWILGITWREIKSIKSQKLAVLTEFNHWRDILLVTLFLTGVIFDIVSYKENTDKIISVSRRDTYSMSIDADHNLHNANVTEFHKSYNTFYGEPVILHRVTRQIRKPGKGAGPLVGGGEGEEDTAIPRTELHIEFLEYYWWHPYLLSNAMFAISTVISFLRMLSYVVVSNVIGPLQISLGSMVTRSAHFFLVVAVVLFSFAVGLTYIYSYYEETNSITCNGSTETCRKGYFVNLFFAIIYLYWSALGLEDQRPLTLDNQAFVLEAAGLVLYGMFYVLLIIVLLNALIAVMSEVYNEVEENADVEWKFHSTVMWMDILLDNDVVPPPFNLLPSYESIGNFIPKYLNFKWKRRNSSYPSERNTVSSIKEKQRSNGATSNDGYKRVMSQLVERYVMAKTADEVSVEAGISFNDILGLRNDILALKMEMFHKLLHTRNHIDDTTVDGSAIRDTSVTAKHVLHKAEEIHKNVDEELLKAVVNFKFKVDERKSEIPQLPDVIVAEFCTQTDPPQNPAVGIQTEEHDIEAESSNARGVVSQLVGAYEKLHP
ncbi:short transient receptor potential channel 5-like [Amphiura filiformis]|uniref:short transient receptor potential channel 5-like n=1 Tax=Amphiura filiformis TaxID=82378 RepID=UPI003B20CCC1